MNLTEQALKKPRALLLLGICFLAVVVVLGFFLKNSLISAEDTDVLGDFVARRSDNATSFFTFVSSIFDPLGTIILSMLAAGIFWLVTRNWRYPGFIFGSVVASAAFTYALKFAFHRSRPPLLDHLVDETDFSFPSGHVTGTSALLFSLAVVLTLRASSRSVRILTWLAAALLVAAVAASRLYLGVHWFTDTAAGALVGTGTVAIMSAILFSQTKQIPARASNPR